MDQVSIASIASEALTLIDAVVVNLNTVRNPEGKSKFKRNDYSVLSLDLELELCQEKLEAWLKFWEVEPNEPSETWQYLWGFDGYSGIRALLHDIESRSKELNRRAGPKRDSQSGATSNKRLSWRQKITKPDPPAPQNIRTAELNPLVENLRRKIDELRLFSESAFEANEPSDVSDSPMPVNEPLITLALDSKDASVALASICSAPSRCFGLDLNLQDLTSNPVWDTKALSYELFLLPRVHDSSVEAHVTIGHHVRVSSTRRVGRSSEATTTALIDASGIAKLDKDAIFSVKAPNGPPDPMWNDQRRISEALESLELVSSRESIFTLRDAAVPGRKPSDQFQPPTRSSTIDSEARSSSPERIQDDEPKPDEVEGRQNSTRDGRMSLEFFQVDSPADVNRQDDVESLHSLFQKLMSSADMLAPVERFSVSNKIELAHTIARTGLLLLGTPWLSYLRSGNIFRSQENKYILSTPTSNFAGHPYNRASDISETSHIFHIGILLIEIALGQPAESLDLQDPIPWAMPSKHLPAVERAMGVQYCKAVSFCMQPRRAPTISQSLSKYSAEDWPEWKSYLERVTAEFHSNVYKRIEELYNSL